MARSRRADWQLCQELASQKITAGPQSSPLRQTSLRTCTCGFLSSSSLACSSVNVAMCAGATLRKICARRKFRANFESKSWVRRDAASAHAQPAQAMQQPPGSTVSPGAWTWPTRGRPPRARRADCGSSLSSPPRWTPARRCHPGPSLPARQSCSRIRFVPERLHLDPKPCRSQSRRWPPSSSTLAPRLQPRRCHRSKKA